MQIVIGLLLAFAIVIPSTVQTTLQGTWEGIMKLPPRPLHLVLHVSRKNGVLAATVGSPDQRIEHTVGEVVAQRVYGWALG